MKTQMKWKWTLGVMSLGLLCGKAQAVNPDTMVVSVTPLATYSVSIASPMAGGYQFGNVSLSATTISTVAIVVTNNGNISEFLSLAVSNTSPDTWTPAASPASNVFRMSGRFNATQPADASFASTDDLTTSAPSPSSAKFGQGGKTGVSGTANLWLRLMMPTSLTTAANAQTMTLTVNGQPL